VELPLLFDVFPVEEPELEQAANASRKSAKTDKKKKVILYCRIADFKQKIAEFTRFIEILFRRFLRVIKRRAIFRHSASLSRIAFQ